MNIRDAIRYGGPAAIEAIENIVREHDQLKRVVRELQRREAVLRDQLEAEALHRQSTERKLQEREAELDDLRVQLQSREGELDSDELIRAYEQRIDNLLGDFKRLRSQAEESAADARKDEKNRILAGLGQILDSLSRAIQMTDGAWRDGLLAIEAQFIKFLKEEGVALIGEPGEEMDPWKHQAVDQVQGTGYPPGTIVEVRRPGFLLDDGTVIRAAEVVVAK